MPKPRIAIIDPNALAALGLRHILQDVMPIMEVDTYGTLAELEANRPDSYFHYFVDMRVVLAHMAFFKNMRHKTIVLASSVSDGASQLGAFHTICVNQPEKQLLRSLLQLEQHAHAHGRNLPSMSPSMPLANASTLSPREIEVLSLVVKGYINKEIADKLCLSLPTIVSHRKNLMSKLGVRSVSALTIYAVMNGYVDVNDI